MSAKWHRSRKWDDEHLPPGLWPVKALLRAFSSISLAVVLLSLVIVYVTLASVPIGMLAQLPTWAVYGAIALGLFGVLGIAPAAGAARLLRGRGRGVRFVSMLVALIAGGLASAWIWRGYVWPAVHHDPATGRGLMFFADFCSRYRSTTLRRMPGMEMTETQFYAWWPMRLALILFVINMIVATVRRIEFNFKNIGVLSVHTGIVLIAVGSVFYQRFKQEGDTLLRSGQPGPTGVRASARSRTGSTTAPICRCTWASSLDSRSARWRAFPGTTTTTSSRSRASPPSRRDCASSRGSRRRIRRERAGRSTCRCRTRPTTWWTGISRCGWWALRPTRRKCRTGAAWRRRACGVRSPAARGVPPQRAAG
jgi:hypothetical protein